MSLNFKQMLLLEVLINQPLTDNRRHIIFTIDEEICSGVFIKDFEGEGVDKLVDIERLQNDYSTYCNEDSEDANTLIKQQQQIIDENDVAGLEEDLRESFLDDSTFYGMSNFVRSIDVDHYFKTDEIIEIIYGLTTRTKQYPYYIVEEGLEMVPLVMVGETKE